ncbi:Hypothetical protein LUCI_4699 [Lucifera butyrica]|uniref:GtrA/DPMS transmembrane domain-containing protein n=1 Tax=Lucifera butyrica TaxID=1351585 RepID=A0A498RDK7_9FIRM|nr:GtrA family protein [Lucifera butyrica]VBB09409.1 Hypothetical protein LUCI_4699 [Lucifera butyrica]
MKQAEARQTRSYIFFGILTTIVNFISYIFFTKIIHFDYKIAASFAWLIAVIFAFITNKLFVFDSRETRGALLVKELFSFLFFRGLSYFVDLLSIIILVAWLHVFDAFAKIISSGIVAILNYFASKYVIFRLKNKTEE